MEGEVPFFFLPGARRFFTKAETHYQFLILSASLFRGCLSYATSVSINYVFLWVISASTLWLRLHADSTQVDIAANYNVYLHLLRNVSTDPSSEVYNTAAITRAGPT